MMMASVVFFDILILKQVLLFISILKCTNSNFKLIIITCFKIKISKKVYVDPLINVFTFKFEIIIQITLMLKKNKSEIVYSEDIIWNVMQNYNIIIYNLQCNTNI